jgi:signal transduction histidine kinase
MELMRRGEDSLPSAPALVAHLQAEAEREKAGVARELHDDLGGLLVAASMDLAWIDGQFAATPETGRNGEVRRRLHRLRDALAGAVDIKRKIIEELRPTLLDNVGLFAALRWLVSTTTARTGLGGAVQFPSTEPEFSPQASIALFRMAQSGIGIITEPSWVRSFSLVFYTSDHRLTLCVSGQGDAHPPVGRPGMESYEFAAMRHRMAALAGGVTHSAAAGQLCVCGWLPVENKLPF